MSFKNANLSVLAYANNFSLWHYKTDDDALSTVTNPGYFNEAKKILTNGNIIIINATDATSIYVLLVNDIEHNVKIQKLC